MRRRDAVACHAPLVLCSNLYRLMAEQCKPHFLPFSASLKRLPLEFCNFQIHLEAAVIDCQEYPSLSARLLGDFPAQLPTSKYNYIY